jgi:beta-lactamase class A
MIALRRSKVQTQRDVLVGKSPATQLNVNAMRMSQAEADSRLKQYGLNTCWNIFFDNAVTPSWRWDYRGPYGIGHDSGDSGRTETDEKRGLL